MNTNVTNLLKKLLVLSLAVATAAPLCAMDGAAGGAAAAAGGGDDDSYINPYFCGEYPNSDSDDSDEDFCGGGGGGGGGGAEAAYAPAEMNSRLLKAASEGNKAAVLTLIRFGADVNFSDQCGNTPLHWAAKVGHSGVVRTLLRRNDININPVDQDGNTPLHLAATGYRSEIEDMLFSRGADETVENNDGMTYRDLVEKIFHAATMDRLRSVSPDEMFSDDDAAADDAAGAVDGDGDGDSSSSDDE